ncbi:MAG: hypothetical protein R3F14_09035 [Polyangiaceae bacterium]
MDIAGQTAWVHDEGFSSGYFHTYDADMPGADDRPRKVHVFAARLSGVVRSVPRYCT